ncbi:MAG: hypothetical protein PHV17_03030 [Candidatus Omnitrophica bacterium]|nr:hypothetical protein [Candidatus Omnitrophota bacterium]
MLKQKLKITFFSLTASLMLILNAYSQQPIHFEPKDLRDPLQSPPGFDKMTNAEQERELSKILSDLRIMGIIHSPNEKYVIINDTIVKEKDSWRGVVVESINKDNIVIFFQGARKNVPYLKESL